MPLNAADILRMEEQLREEEVEALDAFKRGVAEAPVIYKQTGFLLKADDTDTEKPMTFVANEESEDRMGDTIEVAGWKLEDFQKNPVYMFAHMYDMLPIGSVPSVWVEEKQLMNTVKWDDEDPFAAQVKGKYERGFMAAESVGFRPLEFEQVEGKGMFGAFRFTSQELLEISAVPIPAHPKALRKSMEQSDGKFMIIVPEMPDNVVKSDDSDLVTVTLDPGSAATFTTVKGTVKVLGGGGADPAGQDVSPDPATPPVGDEPKSGLPVPTEEVRAAAETILNWLDKTPVVPEPEPEVNEEDDLARVLEAAREVTKVQE
jgi:HK97 family phage prohead protease